jgi:hypothetical protein
MPDNPLIIPNAGSSAFNAVVMGLGDLAYDTTLKAIRLGDGVTPGGRIIPDNVGVGQMIATAIAAKLDRSGGSLTGALGMGNNKVTNLAAGTEPGDAVNKGQLDALGGDFDAVLPLSGGTMTGAINLGGFGVEGLPDPVDLDDAATLRAVLDRARAAVAQYIIGNESDWALAFTDQAGRTAGGFRPDGTFEPLKLKAPLASILTAMLSPDVTARLFASPDLASMLRPAAPDGFHFVDQAGRTVMRFTAAEGVRLFKALLPASVALDDDPATPLSARLLQGVVGSFLKTIPDESGYAFAVTDQAGRIAFGVPTANLPLSGTIAKAKRAEVADALSVPVIASNWTGRKWTSYGDSNTAFALWQGYVLASHAMTLTNRGVGGSKISGADGDTTAMCQTTRIATIPADAQVITAAGGTNDWAQSVPLGVITSTDPTTFYGALNVMFPRIMAQAPNARIFVIATPYGEFTESWTSRSGWTSPTLNSQGLTSFDYRTAMIAVAARFGFPVVDWYGEAGVNGPNSAALLLTEGNPGATNRIHFNDAGARQHAAVATGRLFDLNPPA